MVQAASDVPDDILKNAVKAQRLRKIVDNLSEIEVRRVRESLGRDYSAVDLWDLKKRLVYLRMRRKL